MPGTSMPGEPIGIPATAKPRTPLGCWASARFMSAIAGREVSGQADLTLQHLTAIIVDDLDLAAELLTHLRRPFLATAATRIAVHGDVGRGRCDRWDGH